MEQAQRAEARTSPGARWGHFFVDLKYLWLEQMLEVRTSWYWLLIFSLLMPFAMLFGFARMGSGLQDQQSLLYIVSGSAIFAAANDGLLMTALRIATLRRDGGLIYYASLPISKLAFILALIGSRLILTLPGLVVPMVLAPLLYDVQLVISWWVVPLLVLTALSMSAAGMLLGVLVNSLELVNVLTNALLFVLLMAAPLFIPLEALPRPLRLLSYLLPPSYAADALRRALAGSFDRVFYIDMLLLSALALLSLLVLPRWLRWRAS